MTLDHRLINLLVCPVCKGPLELRRDTEMRATDLVCPADRLAFPIRDGIPVMLENEARPLDGPSSGPPANSFANPSTSPSASPPASPPLSPSPTPSTPPPST